MKTILAFGDSNTWGYIPGSNSRKRYPYENRWTGILEGMLDNIKIAEEGLCGRTTVFDDPLRPHRNGKASLSMILETQDPIEAAVLMLGTNDCKSVYNASASRIGEGVESCLELLENYVSPGNIILVSPILLGENVWRPDKDPEFNHKSVEVSKELKNVYMDIANKRGNAFLAASDYACADEADNEHLNEDGHRKLANALFEKMKEMGLI